MARKIEEAFGASPELVRAELERILSSPTFAQSESLKRFLRYVVESKLEGRGDELKELALGSEVFDRGTEYDPRTDPIVRVQATRLRSKLRDYYLESGTSDHLVISIPKGSYVPEFEPRAPDDVPDPAARPPEARFRPRAAAALGLVAALGGVFLFARFWPRETPPAVGGNELRSLAVLPFTDMSPGGDHAFYGDGLAEEITTTLADAAGLDVVPRTTAFQFRGQAVDLRDVSRRLGADAVLQGSVRRSRDTLRIQVQLIRSSDQRQLWSETYDRPDTDAFEVQEEIARSVASAIRREVSGEEREHTRYVPAAGAYELFLRGRFEVQRNSPASLERGVRFFEEALERDPDYAPAYAGLVDAYVLNVVWGSASPEETHSAAREASERALALGGDYPEPLAAAAAYRLAYEWDLDGAESLVGRAPPSETEDAAALHVSGSLIAIAREDLAAATAELERAARLSTRNPLVSHLHALVAFLGGDLDDARRECRELLDWAPDYPLGWQLLARVESARGDESAAFDALESFERLAGDTAAAIATRGILEARAGLEERARSRLDALEVSRANGHVPPPFIARLLAALGETDAAMDVLAESASERSFPLLWLGVDPDYDPLRRDPRFQALQASLGLD